MPRPRLPGTVLPPRSTLDRFPEHVQAIGMVSIETANLDFMLGELLGALLHIDASFGALVYLTPQSYSGRLQILENVAAYSLQPQTDVSKQIETIITKARAYIGKRHELIHESWGTAADDPTKVVRRRLPYIDKHPARAVPITELTDLIANTRELAEEVMLLTAQLFSEWPPYTSQQISQEQHQASQDSATRSPPKERARPKRRRQLRSSPP
jgi:hypothetical protein